MCVPSLWKDSGLGTQGALEYFGLKKGASFNRESLVQLFVTFQPRHTGLCSLTLAFGISELRQSWFMTPQAPRILFHGVCHSCRLDYVYTTAEYMQGVQGFKDLSMQKKDNEFVCRGGLGQPRLSFSAIGCCTTSLRNTHFRAIRIIIAIVRISVKFMHEEMRGSAKYFERIECIDCTAKSAISASLRAWHRRFHTVQYSTVPAFVLIRKQSQVIDYREVQKRIESVNDGHLPSLRASAFRRYIKNQFLRLGRRSHEA